MNRQQQLIYLAGYIDGDGCFRANITTQKQGAIVYERSITITSVKEEPIIFFKNLGMIHGAVAVKIDRRGQPEVGAILMDQRFIESFVAKLINYEFF